MKLLVSRDLPQINKMAYFFHNNSVPIFRCMKTYFVSHLIAISLKQLKNY